VNAKIVSSAAWILCALCGVGQATDVDYNTNITTTVDNGGAVYRFGVNNPNLVMTISGGGVLTNVSTGSIGVNATATNNAATVAGNGSAWFMSGALTVGSSGFGNSLAITNSGKAYNTSGTLGGNSNVIIVAGSGSIWSNSSLINISGTGNSLIISNGAKVYETGGFPVFDGFGNNIIVDGGQFMVSGLWLMGASTSAGNTITVRNGGYFSMGGPWLGRWGGTYYTFLITDPGSQLVTSGMQMGGDRSEFAAYGHSVIISNGASWTDSTLYLGGNSTPAYSNQIVVTGSGSVITSGVIIGNGSGHNNTMTIANGGRLASSGVTISSGSGANSNAVVITGTNSLWTLGNGTLTIGGGVNVGNALKVSAGGVVSNLTTLTVGNANGANGNYATINSTGAVYCSSVNIGNISGASSNSLTVTNSGILQVNGALTLGNASSVSNELNLCNGGIITNLTTLTVNTNNTLNLYGGTMTVTTLVMNAGAQIGIDAMVTNIVAVSGNVTLNGYLNPSTNLPKVSKMICTVLTYGGSQLGPGLTIGPMPEGFSGMTYTNTGSPNELMLKIIGPPGGMVITIR